MKKNKIVIGSRESKLAVLQSEMVRDYIKKQNPELEVEILTMKTTGDIILDRTLDKVGGKGLFVKMCWYFRRALQNWTRINLLDVPV